MPRQAHSIGGSGRITSQNDRGLVAGLHLPSIGAFFVLANQLSLSRGPDATTYVEKDALVLLHATSGKGLKRGLEDGIINIVAVRQINADGSSPHPNDFPLQALGCPLDY